MRMARHARFALSLFALSLFAMPISSGCGGSDAPDTGTITEPAEGLDEANKNMEQFMQKEEGGATP